MKFLRKRVRRLIRRASVRKISPFFVWGTVAVVAACAPPQPDVSADEEAIRRVNQTYINMFLAGDAGRLIEIYDAAAVLMPPRQLPVEGLDEIRAWWDSLFARWSVVEASSTLDEIIVVGDWAYARGRYSDRSLPADGTDAVVDAGKFSSMWRRQPDGSWKIARDMWNAAAPPAAGN